MKNLRTDLVAAVLLLGSLVSLPARAQIQYFGYVGGADTDWSLGQTRGFTNFAHLSTESNLAGPFIRSRLTAMSPYGIKALIDLGLVLWRDDGSGQYMLYSDFAQRLSTWHQNNADVLTPDRVLAFSVRDEPFRYDVDMATYDYLAQLVKSHFPWAKIYLTDTPCGLQGYCPKGPPVYPTAYANYHGTLPNVDWIGLDDYSIYPGYDSMFQSARATFKSRFPGKKWIYVADGYWDPAHAQLFGSQSAMGSIARQWYDVARADPDAILLGVFGWSRIPGYTMSIDFGCDVLAEHVAIGKAITGKGRSQTSSPTGFLTGISDGVATGWACDPDGLLCERPRLDYYTNGTYGGQVNYPNDSSARSFNWACGATILAYAFRQSLPYAVNGSPITVYAHDLDSAATPQLPSGCAENPACIWYLNYYPPKGYMEAISPSGIASGWVCDPDYPLVSTKVRIVTTNFYEVGTYTTNLGNEPAVTNECGGGTLHRFSVQLPYWPSQYFYAFAEDLLSGEVQIPWLCGDGWSCSW